jgi:DNA-binding response OmpR family regulator
MSPGFTRKPTILMLDDVLDNIKVLGSLLGRTQYALMIATSGEQAIRLALQSEPDLMLLDVMVPDVDGLNVCRRLKKEEKLRDVPVIFLTAKTEPKDISAGFDAGAVDYITKPFHARELKAKVETHLELRFARKQNLRLIELCRQSREILECADSESAKRHRNELRALLGEEI